MLARSSNMLIWAAMIAERIDGEIHRAIAKKRRKK